MKATVSHPHGSASATARGCKCYINNHVKSTLNSRDSVGDAAQNAYHSKPGKTVFDTKRLIGPKVDDPEVERDQKHWPFNVIKKDIGMKHENSEQDHEQGAARGRRAPTHKWAMAE